MNRQRLRLGLITAAALLPLGMMGQETLTLEQCREMALQNNKSIEQAKTRVEMAGYDRKIAPRFSSPMFYGLCFVDKLCVTILL